ncbi:MAG: hypothetical protein H7268_01600 [Sandarakinorhabdus sp.]|nr:hypothetical protein [Sandarakinorhabdus sp.]
MDMTAMDMPGATKPEAAMPGMSMSGMRGALGDYPASREASGTSWKPDNERHDGLHAMAGGWMLMSHANLQLVHSEQGGPRGDSKTVGAGMVIGMAQKSSGDGVLQLRAMLSPEPLMGKTGYPLLLASSETADGVLQLTDRQHPHDLFMELSASIGAKIAKNTSVFAYFGLPGELAFGPPAFMHRAAILDSPEAPISHHWLDSTHISYGVATLGLVVGNAKVEASGFTGREPDQFRYDIESPRFDSTAVRLSWNPVKAAALQASWAYLKSPEQLEPQTDQTRWSIGALFAVPFGADGRSSSTLAWGRRIAHEPGEHRPALDVFAAETSLRFDTPWTVFGRAEVTENDELLAAPGEVHGAPFSVGKISLGAIRDIRIGNGKVLGLGINAARNFVPAGLAPAYDGNQ